MKDARVVYDGSPLDLFKSNYEDYHLRKPDILNAIDKINKEMNLQIKYEDVLSSNDLIQKIKEAII
ncbi:MAG: hypothetical protein K6G48_03220 [Acholeplasmatales bacterium]|nr:hypothetical protein [Acholeplasmatales bacterium]